MLSDEQAEACLQEMRAELEASTVSQLHARGALTAEKVHQLDANCLASLHTEERQKTHRARGGRVPAGRRWRGRLPPASSVGGGGAGRGPPHPPRGRGGVEVEGAGGGGGPP